MTTEYLTMSAHRLLLLTLLVVALLCGLFSLWPSNLDQEETSMTRGRKLGLLLLALAALLVLDHCVMELAPDGEGTEESDQAVTIFTLTRTR